MPYEIETKDGIVVRGIPDDIPPDHPSLKAKVAEARTQRDTPNPTEGNSFLQNTAAGAGKMVADLYRGAKQRLGIGDQQALQTEIDESRKLDKPLMDTAGGKVGAVAGGIGMAAVPALMSPLVATIPGAAAVGAVMGGGQPTSGDESAWKNTALGGALGGAGQWGGQKLAQFFANRLGTATANAANTETQNAGRDAALKTGREAGYVVPPTQVNPTILNRTLEGTAGKLTTAQSASAKNQSVTNTLAARAVGLPENQPITVEALKGVRKAAGQAYDDIRQIGAIQVDTDFNRALDGILSKYTGAEKDFPGLKRADVSELVETLRAGNKTQVSADALVDAIKVVREQADEAFRAGKTGLGSAAKSATQALEDLLERNLMQSGNSGALKAFQDARTLIAKTYTVENALNPVTGTIDAAKLGARLKSGKPITDELRTAAEFQQAFPKAMQATEKMGSLPGTSPLDWSVGALLSGATANPAAMAGVALRPTVRSMLLSKPYQSMAVNPNYSPSMGLTVGDMLTRGGRAAAAGRTALPAAYVATN